ncbi:MAG: permease-like cell division protein FtsX, partial [Lachnospiraceae bacterium]|nr:permease-like cell division protein FtsX [Lachnospiraceae bacterium]
AIGDELNNIPGIYSVRFVSADEAWNDFQRSFFSDMDEDITASFTENPLKDSFNYDVIVELNADTKAVRDQIAQLDGVRHISNLKEEKTQ